MAIAVGGAGRGLGGMMHYTGYGSYTAHRHQHIALMVDRTVRLYAAWDKSAPGPLSRAFPIDSSTLPDHDVQMPIATPAHAH